MATEKSQHGMREAKAEKRRSPKRLERMEIEHAKNGGHVVTHRFTRRGPDGYSMPEPDEQHVFGPGDGKAMLAHVGKAMGAAQPEPQGDADGGADEDEEE